MSETNSEPTTPWLPGHGIHFVPVHIDCDGTLLVPCPAYDVVDLVVAYWAAYCSSCGIVSGPVPNTIGVHDIEVDLTEEQYEAVQPWETVLSVLHAEEVRAGAHLARPHIPGCAHHALEQEMMTALAKVD